MWTNQSARLSKIDANAIYFRRSRDICFAFLFMYIFLAWVDRMLGLGSLVFDKAREKPVEGKEDRACVRGLA